MGNKFAKSIIISVNIFAFMTGCVNITQPVQQSAPSCVSQVEQNNIKIRRNLSCNFYIEDEFSQFVSDASAYDIKGFLAAGVVPHHLLAGSMIASFFARAAQESYDSVIIIGPSHYPNQSKVLSTDSNWNTPFGEVKGDSDFAQAIASNSKIRGRIDNPAAEQDHAVAALVPFVAKYLPGASLGVALMANGTSDLAWHELARQLYLLSQKKRILVVASIDFSHYLNPQTAKMHDEVTSKAVESFDFDSINKMTDSNMDSPETMSVLLEYIKLCGIDAITQLDHSSSDKIIDLPLSHPAFKNGVTTYFIYGAVRA